MGNCLVTKLKESVQNDELLRLGEIKIEVSQVTTLSEDNTLLQIYGPKHIRTTGGKKFYASYADLQADVDGKTEGDVTSSVVYLSNGNYNVFVSDKQDFVEFNSANVKPIWKINVNDLQYSINLTYIKLLGDDMVGNANNIFKLPSLTGINLQGATHLTGNISEIVSNALTTIQLTGCELIEGDATIFADSTKFTSLAYLILDGCTNITNRNDDTKAAIEAAHPNIRVIW